MSFHFPVIVHLIPFCLLSLRIHFQKVSFDFAVISFHFAVIACPRFFMLHSFLSHVKRLKM